MITLKKLLLRLAGTGLTGNKNFSPLYFLIGFYKFNTKDANFAL